MALTETGSNLWLRTEEPLLWLNGCGHETHGSSSYSYDCLQRQDGPHYVLQLTLAGEGFYRRGAHRHLLPAGVAFLDRIPGPFHYGYAVESRWPYEQVYIGFSLAGETWCRHIIRTFGNVLPFGPRSPVETLMLSIVHQHQAGILRDRYTVSGQLYQLLMTIMSNLHISRLAATGRIQQAITLIHELGQDPNFNIQSLARRLNCTREHLCRQFHQATGVTPNDYLVQHRLSLATRLLRQSEEKLENLARRSGFTSANYLCRVFRQHYAVSPAEFRRRPWMVGG